MKLIYRTFCAKIVLLCSIFVQFVSFRGLKKPTAFEMHQSVASATQDISEPDHYHSEPMNQEHRDNPVVAVETGAIASEDDSWLHLFAAKSRANNRPYTHGWYEDDYAPPPVVET